MEYRKLEKAGLEASLFGLGCMRFPTDDKGKIDEEYAIKLIREAIDGGVNYFDTAYVYNDKDSGRVLGKALQGGYREKVSIADKMPVWLAKSQEDLEKIFNEQLEYLQTDHIDMYLVHNAKAANWKLAKRLDLMSFLEKKKAEGKIGHIGFSIHDSLETFKEILDEYPWEFCQLQLNFMDKDLQTGLQGLKCAAEKGIDVIIMEPLKGGRLTDKVPPAVQKLWDESGENMKPVEAAFKWLANMPEIKVILSGVSSIEQLRENIQVFSDENVSKLTDKQKDLITKVSDEYNRLIKYGCTWCNYCLPCPKRLDIPTLINYYNDWNVYEQNPSTVDEYINWIPPGRHASDCIGCRECEEKCTQALPIADIMKEMARDMGK